MNCQIGDLVHIPQASELIDCETYSIHDPQLTIPLRVRSTEAPTVGVVTDISASGGYVRVYCNGEHWAVKDSNVYLLEENVR